MLLMDLLNTLASSLAQVTENKKEEKTATVIFLVRFFFVRRILHHSVVSLVLYVDCVKQISLIYCNYINDKR